MIETVKNGMTFLHVAAEYLGSYWIWLIAPSVVLIALRRKAASFHTLDPQPWKKAFWALLFLFVLGNAVLVYEAYDTVQLAADPSRSMQPVSILR